MPYFDFHVHPSLKAGLTNDVKYNAWSEIPFLATGWRGKLLNGFKEIIESQANLEQQRSAGAVGVATLIGLEKAFAGNFAIQKILASPKVSPLSRQLLKDIVKNKISYLQLFEKDLDTLIRSQSIKQFNIIQHIDQLNPDQLNVLLAIEGAHSFQSDKGESSILENFIAYKNNPLYRFHHLTLTHLTRQPACVHCYGVRIEVIGTDITRDPDFQPDPHSAGLSELGRKLIAAAYENTKSKRILIDVKHMSYLSRQQFYNLRKKSDWKDIPIIVSHAGVTGTSFADAAIREITPAEFGADCDLVSWFRKEGLRNTFFNPWTINFYDEEIVEIIKSGGLIGLSLDQRILGYQKHFFGEFMSPLEVQALGLGERLQIAPPPGSDTPEDANATDVVFKDFLSDPGIQDLLLAEKNEEDNENIRGYDMVFDIEEEEQLLKGKHFSHIDYLSNNILHVVKVGLKAGCDGSSGSNNVMDCVCLGSDLDGVIDSINFPARSGEQSVDSKNWITINEYALLEKELTLSLNKCIVEDDYLSGAGIDVNDLVLKFMKENGMAFLRKHFTA